MNEQKWFKVRSTIVVEMEVPAGSRQDAQHVVQTSIKVPWYATIRSQRMRVQRKRVEHEADWMIPDLTFSVEKPSPHASGWR